MSLGIGNRIKGLRNGLGLSRADFGEKLNITADQVRKIEVEDRMPSEAVYVGMSRGFGFSLDFIFTGNTKDGTASVIPRTPDKLNINMQTIMAKEAIGHLNKCAQSIKSLDCAVIVGIESLEREREKLDKDPEIEKIIGQMVLERGIVN